MMPTAGLRAITALPMRGIEPAVINGELPQFSWVEPQSLFVEESYQRGLGENSLTMIRRIVSRWNWAHIKPPVVVRDGGKLVVIDGQHTAIAATSHGKIAKIPVMIVEAKTRRERATAFISQNRDRLGLTAMHLHFAALAADDEIAVAVDEACRKSGVTIVRNSRGPGGVYRVGETFAVGIIGRIVKKVGVHHGARLLKVLVEAKRAPIPANEIAAVAILLFDPKYKERVDAFDLATVIRSRSVADWKARAAKLLAAGIFPRTALATVFYKALQNA